MKNILFALSIISSLLFSSCSSDENIPIPYSVNPPKKYNFKRDDKSTVSFEGQKIRILMGGELKDALLDFDNSTEESLFSMFAHQTGELDFSKPLLNDSDKNLRSKTAVSIDFFGTNVVESEEIKTILAGFISSQVNEVFPNKMIVASPGIAGQIADGDETRYVSGKGLEYNEAFANSLLGAVMLDQMINHFLSPIVLDQGNNQFDNDNKINVEGETYTAMEHNWDEAYGYLYGNSQNPKDPNLTIGEDDVFLNEYVGNVSNDPDFANLKTDIWEAFKTGRTALVANNYIVRDLQANIVKAKVSKVVAIRGVFFLQKAKQLIAAGNRQGAFHALSEAYGSVFSLRFTRSEEGNAPLFSRQEVDSLLNQLINSSANGFWDVTPQTLQSISQAIASKFNFTVEQAASI